MVNFLMPIAISIINKAVDRIPDDLDSVIKDFLIKLLKKAAAKTGNKVDDQLVEALQPLELAAEQAKGVGRNSVEGMSVVSMHRGGWEW